MLKTGWIDEAALPYFSPLLLPDMADALARDKAVLALGLTENEVAVGALAGFLDGGVFYVRSLYVAPACRRRGGGHMLLQDLCRVLCSFFDRPVQVSAEFTVTQPEHRELMAFLEAEGFAQEADDGRNIYRTTLGAALSAGFFQKPGSRGSGIVPLAELSRGMLLVAQKKALQAGVPLPEGGLLGETVDRELSMAYVKKQEVGAFLLFCREGSALAVSSLWSGSTGPAILPSLMRACAGRAAECCPDDTVVTCQTVNDASAGIRRLLLPDAEPVSYTYSAFLGG